MKLQEWKNTGTNWQIIGQWNDLTEDQIDPLVEQYLVDNTKLVLLDEDDDYVKEWVK